MIRVSTSDIGSSDCPKALALKVRPESRTRTRDAPALLDFTLGPLMDALDRVEFGGREEEDVIDELVRTRGAFGGNAAPAHPGLVSWSVEAFHNYRAAWRSRQETVIIPCSRPVRYPWMITHSRETPDHRGVRRYEQTCWGRRYQSEDGSVREMWLLGLTTPKARSPVVHAAAANIAAFGGSRSSDRVRLVGFGAMSPLAQQFADWTVDEIRQRAADEVAPRLHAIVDGTERRAGRDCAACSLAPGCAALPSASLIPDVHVADGPRRVLSVTDLRYYTSCPARYHLARQLHLHDVDTVESQRIAMGRTVDAILRDRHASTRPDRCAPDQPNDEFDAELSAENRHLASRMLARHAAWCPFPDVDEYDGPPINQVVVHDERLNVIFIAAPDLVYPRSGGWVWRETKTSQRRLRRDRSLLRQVPQLALAVLMVASGALGRDIDHSAVEFEQLRPDGSTLEELDPGNPAVVVEAREIIGEAVRSLTSDSAYEPAPGPACADCAVRRWCTPGSQHIAQQRGGTTSRDQ